MAQQTDLIAVRANRHAPGPEVRESLFEELDRTVRGEVRFDEGSLGLYTRDASNFRMVPIGVVLPKDADDVIATVAACRARGVPVLSRGGGTSLAGQCVNTAVVMDFTKYMNRVLEIDPERRIARVEPGCILDDLRDAAAPYGLTFGPDPATHDHCSLGGMIGNNACGIHAVLSEFYGPGARTEDNLRELEILTYDGLRMRVGATPEHQVEDMAREGGRRGEIYRALRDLRDRYAEEIRRRFPDIPRRVSGYSLPALLPENGFDVAKALAGSEGTCVTMLEATVELVPAHRNNALLVLGFEDVFRAGDAVPRIRELPVKPIGGEGLDDVLVSYVQKKRMHDEYLPLLPDGKGFLLVQFGADGEEAAREAALACLAELGDEIVDHRLYGTKDAAERAGIWEIRESGLGATAFVPDQDDAWPGWEDAAVAPENVGPYLRDFRALLDEFGYEAALYGHFLQGCIHTRIPFRLTDPEGLRQYREFTRRAAELVVRYGGSLSGEHGDGQQRGELLPIMFGDEIMQAFREFKSIWDPKNRMNPGKLIDARPRDQDLELGADYAPWEPETHFPFAADNGHIAHATLRCVGVGKCRRQEPEGVMCPSFMVTREEKHTTRGRAHLLNEMLKGEVITDGWKSEEVKDALDLCLSCKGCTYDCPVNVDIPTLKAEFLSHYWEGEIRPRHAYAFGLIHRWARIGSLLPELTNFLTQTPGLRAVAKWAADMHQARHIPEFAPQTFRQWWRKHAPKHYGGRRVILWPDTFNDHFYPETLAAAAETLIDAGCEVVIPKRHLCCGRPLYDYGMLDMAKKLFEDILEDLRDEIEAGTPLVGVEPSCTAAFRDELKNLFPADPLAKKLGAQTYTVAEMLHDQIPGYRPPRMEGRKALIHIHCHHQGVMGGETERKLLKQMGIDADQPQKTCCGMAGSWGMEKDHYDVSMQIGELKLLPEVRRATDDTLLVADGFSCRSQVQEATDRRPLHIAEVIQLAKHHERHRIKPEEQQSLLHPRALQKTAASPAAKVAVGAGLIAAGGYLAYRMLRK